ncbi:PD-(D/E)XK nuclease family protein [Actinotalea sp. K2]|uniref:PD-(D/E)XK nuclease family protein n=1 Tax=Actinotalea sp. K2 TaxID=2939438 RepID=UPI002017401D|nr:PD-(D/E)XK nuclease family protein [Actinotalea sp. K2]MCL3862963.1 PD-(D/E)XK nuclease family protein [Actinotalea sp. K2]
MPTTPSSLDQMVTALVPSLSRSLAEQFNVFRVMHHGTHEKQLSNVFAWLLRVDGTHGLGDAFQILFVEHVNRYLPAGRQVPVCGYRVVQEVDTSGPDPRGRDIADIVLASDRASVVVENFESSDGHGHDYEGYLAFGAQGGKQSAVVLLCARHENHRQKRGWERAVVLTYAELLAGLSAHIADNTAWRCEHPQQLFFINEMFHHFLEGPTAMNIEDRITFIRTMCETGESARYGHRPQEVAAQEFADLLAQHARRQFDEGRGTLAEAKRALKRFAEQILMDQINSALQNGHIASVQARFVGQWEWCITLGRSDSAPAVYLEFGPTAVVENGRAPVPLADPDYAKVFVTRKAADYDGIDQIVQTAVGLDEVLAGLGGDDVRLRDGVLAVVKAN